MSTPDPSADDSGNDNAEPRAESTAGDSDKKGFALHKPDGQPVRAGRNLPLAVITGVALGALVLGSLFTFQWTFVVVLSAGFLLGLRELWRAFAAQETKLAVLPLAVGGITMLAGAYFGGTRWLFGALALTAIATLVWRLAGGANGYLRDVGASLFTLVYVPMMLAFWLLMLDTDGDGRSRLIVFIIVTIASDIGGYFAGIFFGRHKMAPTISPNKTWEGFAGSMLTCVVAGVLSVVLLLDGAYWAGIVLGAAVCVAAILGDLIESVIKRDTGVKDMGSFLPGHGGLLDRLDSLLVAGPVAWLVLTLLVSSA
ncbi:phosphatidate cytidylyltransferase [Spiractinospora alimapuensis]|uniref:phosphatidate cytidylyltransferase n=1 Tax=Spiractinospora alimapuensis TaxID=2820884 RepID=UPI001F229BE0|nr:phosphatidate cytidylyltransferase [Spiractinospora alimapuensis]QVQ51688.1 phosphatidate cytidylyltransferase [Spiractinospora alimapuensis]